MSVLFLPEVSEQFVELADLLYDNGYLSFLDTAIAYAEGLFRQIQAELPIKVHRQAPAWFKRYGKELLYATFPKNNHTTWYVFFNVYEVGSETVYLVRHLSNNHVAAQYMDL